VDPIGRFPTLMSAIVNPLPLCLIVERFLCGGQDLVMFISATDCFLSGY